MLVFGALGGLLGMMVMVLGIGDSGIMVERSNFISDAWCSFAET